MRETLSANIETALSTLLGVTVMLIVLFSIVFLAFSNRVATKGYALKELKNERAHLSEVNEAWNMRLSQARAVDTLAASEVAAKMVSMSTEPLFLRGDTAVAKGE